MQIACSHCGATYAFDAALIPQEGYDARCTSCQGVFFVRPDGSGTHQAEGLTQPVVDAGEAAQITFAPESLHRGTMEIDLGALEGASAKQPAPAPAKKAPQPAPAQSSSARRANTMDGDLDLGPRLGRRRAAESDHEPMLMRKPWARRGLFLGVALVAVIGSGVVVGVVCSKRLHAPPSVQPPIHVVRAPDPIAAEAFSRGIKALWNDTVTDYLAATKAFDAACARDPEFTDAWAGAALAALLLADDLHAEAIVAARSSQAVARQTLSEVARLAHAQGALSGSDAVHSGEDQETGLEGASAAQLLRLQKSQGGLWQESQDKALSLHQRAYDLQRRGASLLLHGDHLMTQTPLMALALAMWYVSDPQSIALAKRQLRAFEQLTGGDCMPIEADPNNCVDSSPVAHAAPAMGLSAKMAEAPYGPLAFWIEARLIALQAGDAQGAYQQAVAAYEKALTLMPNLRRARWELAQYELRAGRVDVARPLLEDLAHGTPPHNKSQADLKRLMSQVENASGAG